MSERGIDKPGWLMRQLADVQRESKSWPERMKRAVEEKVTYGTSTRDAIAAAVDLMDAEDQIDLDRVAWGIVANARHVHKIRVAGAPLWSVVKNLTGLGATKAKALCRRYGFDPDEPLKG